MKIEPFSEGSGGLVTGAQISALSDGQISELQRAFVEFGVLFFRRQELSPDQHLLFARRFGAVVRNKFFQPLDGYPDIAIVSKSESQETNIGGGWHTDHSYDAEPAMGSILVARQLPRRGGNTRFANLVVAYDGLSDGLKQTLQSLRALHSNRHLYGEGGYYSTTDMAENLSGINDVGDAVHPVVIRHPQSGRKLLYVNPAHTVCFEGWTTEESGPLLDYLYTHVDQPLYTCEFDWQPGSVAMWDNRSTWHFANNDYQGEARLMHRITLAGSELTR